MCAEGDEACAGEMLFMDTRSSTEFRCCVFRISFDKREYFGCNLGNRVEGALDLAPWVSGGGMGFALLSFRHILVTLLISLVFNNERLGNQSTRPLNLNYTKKKWVC